MIQFDENGKAYDQGDYNSSFALQAVELKKGNNSESIFFYFSPDILLIIPYLAEILFEVWRFQDFLPNFSRAVILKQGDNSEGGGE